MVEYVNPIVMKICHEMFKKPYNIITQPKKNIKVTTMRNPSHYMGVSTKNRGGKPPKMDGLFHGKPY